MKNHLFPKNNLFLSGRIVSQKMVFLVLPRKKLVFLPKTIFFLMKKLVFHAQTIFCLGKGWFSCPKPSFLGKTKKTTFLVSGRIVSQKIVFLVFPRKKLVFLPKTIFFQGKGGCLRQTNFFPEKSRYFTPRPSFSKQRVCIYFMCCLRALRISAVNIRFQCHHYCDSSPLRVSTIQ